MSNADTRCLDAFPEWLRSLGGLESTLRHPTKVALLLGGSALVTFAYLVALFFSVEAFGGPNLQLVLPCLDPATGDTTLNLVSLDGTVIRVIDRGWLSDPAMTPDGRYVVYWRNDARQEGGAIFRAAVDGSSPPVPITQGGAVHDNDAAASPDGDLIAITRAGQGIWTISLGSGVATQLTKQGGDQDPSWSPDGSQITFKRQDQLWIMNADGTGVERISKPGDIGTAAAWSPR